MPYKSIHKRRRSGRNYAKKHKTKISKYRKKWCAKNKEKCYEYTLHWRSKNAVRYKKKQAAWYQANRDKAREQNKKWHIANKDRVRNRHRVRNLEKMYGLDQINFNIILKRQKGRCAVCRETSEKSKKSLGVDHCHITNYVRGLLCSTCNTALGLLQDDPKIIKALLGYLVAHKKRVSLGKTVRTIDTEYKTRSLRISNVLDELQRVLSRGNLVTVLQVSAEMGCDKMTTKNRIKKLIARGCLLDVHRIRSYKGPDAIAYAVAPK